MRAGDRDDRFAAPLRPWVLVALTLLAMSGSPVAADAGPGLVGTPDDPSGGDLVADLVKQLASPLFWFGMVAQGLFFTRFFIQWLVSEKHKRSTVPTVFWYFSLAGASTWFIYGVLRRDLAIMLGAVLSCFFYLRNVMLIHGEQKRQQASSKPLEHG